MSGIQKWAPQTWNFFHTFAAKISDTFYQQNKEQCLQIIKLTCQSLPCPECTKHAIQFMNTVNSKNVKNKEELIEMLYTLYLLLVGGLPTAPDSPCDSLDRKTFAYQIKNSSTFRYR